MADGKPVGGGSLLVAWQLKDKIVLIVGGGEIGAQRIDSLLTTDAQIVLVAPPSGLHARTKQLLGQYPSRITLINEEFRMSPDGSTSPDLSQYDMVLTALDDHELSKSIVRTCRRLRIPVNTADIPDLCDFYFGGQVRDGPLQIMISTNGNGPRLAALIKDRVKTALSGHEGRAITQVGILRAKLKERAPGVGGDLGRRRMRWMSKVCEQWSMEQLARLDEAMMEKLLDEGWEKNTVLKFTDVSPQSLGEAWWSWARRGGAASLPSLFSFFAGIAVVNIIYAGYARR